MGIDIYLHWRGQTEEEEKAQATGFAIDAGDVGYLREAYHGAPYVTKFFLQEAFENNGEAAIPAAVLRERLPVAVLMSLFREHKLYGDGKDPAMIRSDGETSDSLEKLGDIMKNVFEKEVHDMEHEKFAAEIDKDSIKTAEKLIAIGALPDYAQAFVDFVELAEKKEALLGEPCVIKASY